MSQKETTKLKSNGPTSTKEVTNSPSNFRDTSTIPDAILIPDMEKEREKEPDMVMEEVPKTPFTLIKKDEKYFLAFTNYAVSHTVDTREEALELLEEDKWGIMAVYIMAVLDRREKLGKENPS